MTAPEPAPPPASAVPVCPRHPDRVSYVRCQRCERPVCAECQRPAAVGVHCVDCVRDAARTAPVHRTIFGAVVRRGPPVVTYTLIGLCLASYVLQWVLGWSWTGLLAFQPAAATVEPWRFVTAAFVHSTQGYLALTHIGFNMYVLWILGRELEVALGRWRMAALFLVSVVGGHVAVMLLAGVDDWWRVVVGASGGVFGLFGALVVVLRRMGRSPRAVLAIIAVNAVIGFVVPNIAWQAHLGGLLVGAALGAAFAYAPKGRRTLVGAGASGLVLAVLVLLAVLRTTTL
ncbi:rhomboid family intramembrane serine protease [Actinotalea ferrariae]|uniref:rhomboid family intramembrane serine protease n=1 Tax=Actinotalea ferrariae TaxID=1386098 RepID=UPI001C8B2F9E|nr:rhomboid family intramembrane serine protease [Actinotalea ferrariae]MBX9243444.1 rhomboid family intramembrane serine protease [Actinotalea ferrariae]